MASQPSAPAESTVRGVRQQIAEQRAELAVLIKQAELEVDRGRQRLAVVNDRLAELDRSLDRYTKAELRDLYSAARDAHMRLFMMESQLEGLRQRDGYLARVDALLAPIEALGAPEPARARPAPVPSAPLPPPDLLFATLERDRLRVSRQIHDGPAQALSNVVLRAEICERLLDLDPAGARAEMTRLKATLGAAVLEIRRIIFELRPMMLEDLGLVPTLRRYLQARAGHDNLAVDLVVEGVERRLPIEVEVALFRVAQEALANVRRHAATSSATLSIEFAPDHVALAVSDRGRGFLLEETLQASARRAAGGLWAMGQRARALAGELQVASEPGRGTVVRLIVPTSDQPSP